MGCGEKLSPLCLDALREIGNIGIGNAATALAGLLGTRVNITVPHAVFQPLEDVLAGVGGLEEPVAGVHLRIDGDLAGTVLYLFSQESAFYLIDMLLGQPRGTTRELDALGRSVIAEAGNILTGAFVGAIAGMTGLKILPAVPMFAFDMLGAVITASFAASGCDDLVLLIETDFMQEDQSVKGHFIMLLQPGYLQTILQALGITL
ncbi:MAG: chemotaxis protein CheC [Bacillota bacterium]